MCTLYSHACAMCCVLQSNMVPAGCAGPGLGVAAARRGPTAGGCWPGAASRCDLSMPFLALHQSLLPALGTLRLSVCIAPTAAGGPEPDTVVVSC